MDAFISDMKSIERQ